MTADFQIKQLNLWKPLHKPKVFYRSVAVPAAGSRLRSKRIKAQFIRSALSRAFALL